MSILIYGATGYTGKLVSRLAAERGVAVTLSGRNADKLAAVAAPLGLPYQALPLDDARALEQLVADFDVVLHIAGPFSGTGRAMVDACLAAGSHYLDLTGEIDYIEACAARSNEAAGRGVMVMCGVGFDVVPTDCLALHVKQRLPDADRLLIAIRSAGGVSRGTMKTLIEQIGFGTRVRRQGAVVRLGQPLRVELDFGGEMVACVASSWGDVVTAHHTTGIPDITDLFAVNKALERLLTMPNFIARLISSGPGQALFKWLVDRQPEGPGEAARERAVASVMAQAENAAGDKVRSRLQTPDPYKLTSLTALEIARRVAEGAAEPGFRTPAQVFGADFITTFEGCVREDLD